MCVAEEEEEDKEDNDGEAVVEEAGRAEAKACEGEEWEGTFTSDRGSLVACGENEEEGGGGMVVRCEAAAE